MEGKRCILVCSKTRCKIKKPSLILNTEPSARCFFLPVWHASRVRLHTTRGRKCKLVSDANCTILHCSPQQQQLWPALCLCFASPLHAARPRSQQLTVETARCSQIRPSAALDTHHPASRISTLRSCPGKCSRNAFY